MEKEFIISSEEALTQAVEYVLTQFKDHRNILLIGHLGTGKTTFTKYFCDYLGVPKHGISSPTFGIVTVHQSRDITINHFDLYRIKSTEELLDIGFEDYIYSKAYNLIEWPEIALSIIPKPYLQIQISIQGLQRHIKIETKN
jgi:tRNA threonylcarbamoyladenosine biosynthesis protein TsaE